MFAGVSDTTVTLAPSAANSFAVARPMPRPAPVTIAILPLSLPMFISCEDAEDLVQDENIAQY
jgi:hypothetical protein